VEGLILVRNFQDCSGIFSCFEEISGVLELSGIIRSSVIFQDIQQFIGVSRIFSGILRT
jgi:hypothetical protein